MRASRPLHPLLLPLPLLALLVGCGGDPWDDELPVGSGTWAVHTVCGGGQVVRGIDVSKWQGTVDWHRVKGDGMVFGVARVSDGLNYPDAYFARNWKEMRKEGLIRGVYQYFRPNQSATAQANYLITEVKKAGGFQKGDLPAVLDLEATGGQSASTIVKQIDTWLSRVEQGTGRRPIIYTGSYFWDGKVLSSKHTKYPLWTAHYTTKACPLVPNPWNKWVMWQYTSKGKVSGTSGNCDVNRFNGTLADLKAFAQASLIHPPRPDQGVPPKPDMKQPPGPDRGISPRPDRGISPGPDMKQPPRPRDGATGTWLDGGSTPPVYTGQATVLFGGCTLAGSSDPPPAPLWLALLLLALARRRRPRKSKKNRSWAPSLHGPDPSQRANENDLSGPPVFAAAEPDLVESKDIPVDLHVALAGAHVGPVTPLEVAVKAGGAAVTPAGPLLHVPLQVERPVNVDTPRVRP